MQIAAEQMTTPDQTPDTELETQELAEENLEGVSGGAASPKLFSADPDAAAAAAAGGRPVGFTLD